MTYPLQAKVGTRLSFPQNSGLTVSSSDTSVISVMTNGPTVQIDAKKPGDATLSVQAGNDLKAELRLSVTA